MNSRRFLATLAAVFALTLVTAACSSNDNSGGGGASGSGAAANVTIVGWYLQWNPASAVTLTVTIWVPPGWMS